MKPGPSERFWVGILWAGLLSIPLWAAIYWVVWA